MTPIPLQKRVGVRVTIPKKQISQFHQPYINKSSSIAKNSSTEFIKESAVKSLTP